jgi:HEAT repeat protein
VLLLSVLFAARSAVAAPPTVADLADRLKHGEDFRVRLQAALELGKTAEPDALEPLVAGLDDPNASVRTGSTSRISFASRSRRPSLRSSRRVARERDRRAYSSSSDR